MSREHTLRCTLCQTEIPLGKLIDRRPELAGAAGLAVWTPELTALLTFLSQHVTYAVDRPHTLELDAEE